jgi:hypothetical protein
LCRVLTTDDQIALKSNISIRVWSSRGADGSEYIQDGLLPAANNRETGWMERCDTRSASNLILTDKETSEDARRYLYSQSTIGRIIGPQSHQSTRP